MPTLANISVGRTASYAFIVILLMLSTTFSKAQKLDQNANGMSDVWEQIYGAATLDPNGDNDGDGVSNAQEALAGTSPFLASSVPKIPTFTRNGTNFTVTVSSALGKQYELQSIQPVNGLPWTN